jgi:putative hydrolase of the HAD superfamily
MSQTSGLTTMVFDLSEVLLSGLLGTAHQLTPVLSLSPQQIDRQLKIPAWDQLQTGRIFENQYWTAVRQAAGWNVPNSYLRQAVRQNFREIEAVRPQIVDLRRRGYKLGLVSNHAREWIEWLEQQFRFQQLFDDHVYSFQVGMVKPDRAIYALALRRLGVAPESTLVIDDDPENLLSANVLGCQVLQFITAHQLATDLRRLRVTD